MTVEVLMRVIIVVPVPLDEYGDESARDMWSENFGIELPA